MSENEKQDEKPTPFEKALAGLQPQPDRLDSRWRALLAREILQKANAAADSPQPREMSPCSAASDHVFACVYCGVHGPRIEPSHRWVWPAAFSAMTAVAALLLVMLVARSEPNIALHDAKGIGLEEGFAATAFSDPAPVTVSDQLCYLGVRRQVLRHGVESWQLPASTRLAPEKVREAPLIYREQLNRFLNQPDSASL
jgi:hypothetical protein